MKTLTVKQLIELLQTMDEKLPVVREDNSGGYESIGSIQNTIIRDNFNKDADFEAIVIH